MTKFQQILSSRNFLVSLISMIAMGLAANNTDLGGYTPDSLYDLFVGKSGNELLITIVLYVLNSGSRIYLALKGKKIDYSFLKSSNFQATVISLLSIFISAYFKEPVAGFVIGITVQLLNILYNSFIIPIKEPIVALTIEPINSDLLNEKIKNKNE